jgi:predicted acetyltransferase
MAIEIRSPSSEEEFRTALDTVEAAFGEATHDEDFERFAKVMGRERVLCGYDGDAAVATAAAFPFELTVPGGSLRAGGVTWVGVLPSHRRRGILTQLMRRQLLDLRRQGEPLAILWASESAIYGRFGYGIAAPALSMNGERTRFGFRDDPGPSGTVRLLDRDEAAKLFPPVYDEVQRRTSGMFVRSESWWRELKLADPEHWRRGAGPKFYAAVELDGRVAAYAMYRVKQNWEQGMSRGELRVVEALATSAAAARELWRFLFGIDLVARVEQWMHDPNAQLFLTVADPRSLHLELFDGLWLRLVDVEAALGGRTYGDAEPVVLDVRDGICEWNAGRYRVGAEVARTADDADLELDVADLASAYLGAFDFHQLAAGGRTRELRRGGLARASALFRTERMPYCPEEF